METAQWTVSICYTKCEVALPLPSFPSCISYNSADLIFMFICNYNTAFIILWVACTDIYILSSMWATS